jgi:Kef-type K+ transport system membrane component KefB
MVAAAFILPWLTPVFSDDLVNVLPNWRQNSLCSVFLRWGLATWADSEAVLPAYLIGMVLAGTVGKDHSLIRRLRTLTFGLLTPFYFLRAGSLVSLPALVAAPGMFLLLLFVKMGPS